MLVLFFFFFRTQNDTANSGLNDPSCLNVRLSLRSLQFLEGWITKLSQIGPYLLALNVFYCLFTLL
jgi:hypothetical protein